MNDYKIPVAKHLTDFEYSFFLEAHLSHTSSMGKDERAKYNLCEVKKVSRGKNCLHVHYKNGNWWHYTPGGTWY